MTRTKELLRKFAATVVAVVLMVGLIVFAFKMLLSVPIFDPKLQTVLLICTGVLSLATLYFLFAKISEMVALLRAKPNQRAAKPSRKRAQQAAAPSTDETVQKEPTHL
ncbi:MAG: hypothetical protein KBG54_01035 [Oscillospiraceae bacterium]|nr:hypothetical protein [Oscillospiraceae bacterium]